jgi:hypothetical protein
MRVLHAVSLFCATTLLCSISLSQTSQAWKVHDMNRPHPPVVQVPGLQLPVAPPSDAIVLFDGKDLSHWRGSDGGPAKWTVEDGYFATVAGTGYIHTQETFGDVQLHIEWATPTPAKGSSQGRGNSGVFLMGMYEIQVLDSYQNDTYADGQAAAVYAEYPPMYNASRPPGEWQSYDIFFRAPRFDDKGALLRPARLTLLHNGVLVQDNVELTGPNTWLTNAPYKAHTDRLPLSLQDHSNPVRFRNVWARELVEQPAHSMITPQGPSPISIPANIIDRYIGKYESREGSTVQVTREGESVYANIGSERLLLDLHSNQNFPFVGVDGGLEFRLDPNGMPDSCYFRTSGGVTALARHR